MIARKRQIALGVITSGLLVAFVIQVAGSPVSFDGAMNLQVAASLADGLGYARFYDEWILFPEEVQTNAPFIIPAAAIFSFLGVNLLSAQLVSIAYAVALVATIIWLVRPISGITAAFVAALLVLISPEFSRFAAHGYGEVPGLFWFLLGLGLFCRAHENQKTAAYSIAGLCLGLAVLTKTVMLMPVGILLALSGATLLLERRWSALATTTIAFFTPVGLFEAWRAASLGGLTPYSAWWADQFQSIFAQAGIHDEFRDTPVWTEKLLTHASILADAVSLPVWLLPILALVPLGLAWIALGELRKGGTSRGRFILMATLALSIAAYFTWWLGVTPTEKAWHRRIFNGLLLLAIAAPLVFEQARSKNQVRSVPVLLVALPLLALIYSGAVNFKVFPTENRWPAVREAVEFMRAQPQDTRFYGSGWYSAPVFSLYSGRHIHDLAVWKPFIEPETGTHYLLVDSNMIHVGARDPALHNLGHRTVVDELPWAEVVEITDGFRYQSMPEFDPAQLAGQVDFLESEYRPVQGFHKPEGDGWRWVEPVARIALKPTRSPVLIVRGFTPPVDKYLIANSQNGIFLKASIGDCALGERQIVRSGIFELEWPLGSCPDPVGEFVIVTLRANAAITRVDRRLSWIVHSIGFSDQGASK